MPIYPPSSSPKGQGTGDHADGRLGQARPGRGPECRQILFIGPSMELGDCVGTVLK